MRKSARQFRAQEREVRRQARAQRDAREVVVLDGPHTAKEFLVALGLDYATADRFAGAFSKGVPAARVIQRERKLKGRKTKVVDVKLYDWPTFAHRLVEYRPKSDTRAAAAFAELAELVAA